MTRGNGNNDAMGLLSKYSNDFSLLLSKKRLATNMNKKKDCQKPGKYILQLRSPFPFCYPSSFAVG
jgi:hypothetical protein